MKNLILFILFASPIIAFSQRVGVNTSFPAGSLEIVSSEANVTALKVENVSGDGADINILTPANTGIGLRIDNSGVGRSLQILSTEASSNQELAFLQYEGLGRVIEIQSNNTSNGEIAFYLNNKGKNHAMQIQNSNVDNINTAIDVFHLGLGQVLDLQNTNNENTRTTLNVKNSTVTENTNIGYAIRAETRGARASYFVNYVGGGNTCGVYGRNNGVNDVVGLASAGIIASNGGNLNGNSALHGYGDITATSKSFLIDHPIDPANKFLKHFSIESDEALLIYRGQAVLDENGKAVIELKDYQQAIISNVTYNLTAIGSPTVFYVERELNNKGQFIIAGNNPGSKVNWTLYAERTDAYFKQYPQKKIIEIEKEEKFKGLYISPLAHGKTMAEAMDQPDRKESTKN